MASNLKLANNAVARLSVALSASTAATTIVVAPGQGVLFPALSGSQYFPATLTRSDGAHEVVKVTARNTDTFTVLRAQETTVALAFAVNDFFELRLTAGAFQGELDAMSSALAAKADAAATASALAGKADAAATASALANCLLATTAAATYFPKSGGALTDNIIFPNSKGVLATDTLGAVRAMLYMDGANKVNLISAGGQGIGFCNSGGGQVASCNEQGDFTLRSWTTTSDARLKTNRRPLDEAMLDRVADLVDAGYFDWIDGSGTALGLSAQELQKIGLDVAVKADADGKLSVDYAGLTAVLVQAMLRREKRRHAEYEARFAALEAK